MDLHKEIDKLIDRAIEEDIGTGDISSLACIPDDAITSGRLFLKQSGVIAGLSFLEKLYAKINPEIQIKVKISEGSFQKAGTEIGKVTGPARDIISGERIALSLLQHASGVATITRAFVRKVAGTNCVILDTRKTLPGLRALEKYAVKVGGGVNHRYGLSDRFIIKNHHFAFLPVRGSKLITEAVKRAKEINPALPIEIEIQDPKQLDLALKTEADTIMLNKMTPYEIRKCVTKVRATDKKVYIESSGAITLDTIRYYAETGVDGISVTDLTDSIQDLDIGMRITP